MGKRLDRLHRGKPPITAADFFNNAPKQEDSFSGAPKESTRQDNFSALNFEYLRHPEAAYTSDKQTLKDLQSTYQPTSDLISRTSKQFGANLVSGLGQGLANTFDLISLGHTVKAGATGGVDNFQSSLFGLSTKEMQDWANNVAERNKLYEKNEGSFNLTDPAWWGKQIASSGTGIGMGLEALAETAAIEYATGGMGTGAALMRLGSLGRRIVQGARGAEILAESISAAKGLRSAATLYGVLSRSSESRMEAMNSYDEIYQGLQAEKNKDGTNKYTPEQLKELSTSGAKRTFLGNMALLPLDIIGYRTMMYNPISGAGEGLIENVLGKIGNKALRRTVQFGTEALLEGTEEGFQFIAEQEGKQYARVLGGMDDKSTFLQRVGKDVSDAEFWNNFAGGVIGSPIIGGFMKLTNKIMSGNRTAKLEGIHRDFIENVGALTDKFANDVKDLEAKGDMKSASIARRQFHALKALSALHLDAMLDKDSAFDAHTTFVSNTLGELNENKLDSLQDLGFTNPTAEQIKTIKEEFTNYLDDAKTMKQIYDQVKDKYNKNFVPEVAYDHFQLDRLSKEKADLQTSLALKSQSLPQYTLLSPQGKQIYDSEYKLKSLQAELNRLTEQHRKATDQYDKADLASTIEDVKAKMTTANENLTRVQDNEGYNAETKKLDNEIIASALRSDEYLQSVYDNERLDNEISLKRKEIARWNKPEYVAHKNKEAIKNARTKTQVDATKENLDKNGQNTKDTQTAINDKEDQLAVSDAAKAVQEKGQATQGTNEGFVPGNSNLFADEESNNFINGLKSEVGNQTNAPELHSEANEGEHVATFSPVEFDFNKSSEEAKDRIVNGVKGLVTKLGNNVSFENLVREVVSAQGITTADQIFNALKYGWENSGQQPVDYNAVYSRVFGNPLDLIMSGVNGLTPVQTHAQTEEIKKDLAQTQEKPVAFDNNNQPVYEYKGFVTNESSPKFAFVSKLNRTIVEEEEGKTVVDNEYTDDELNRGDYVDSLQLLDPDKWNEGTEAEIRVPNNFMDLKIPVYNADGTKGQSVTFGQYVAQKGLSPNSQEYKDKLPMIIYRKGAPANEKGVAFVHDAGWYNTPMFNQNVQHQDDKANAIKNTRAIRQEVLDNKGKSSIVITSKRQTTFKGLKVNENIPLREANPQTKIVVALTTDSVSTSKKTELFPNSETTLLNQSPFRVGQVLEVRRFGTKDGKNTFMAFPVTNPKLDDAAKGTIVKAIEVYASRSNKDPQIRAKHDAVAKQIKDVMGIDILNPQGLEQYLKHFITTFNTEKAKTNQDVELQAKSKLPLGSPYLAFIAGGNIVFGKAGMPLEVNKQSMFINPNSTVSPTYAIGKLIQHLINQNYFQQNVNLDNLSVNKPIVTIDGNYNTNIAAPSYNDYLLDRLLSNVKSYNIGTKESPNYVTNIQPVITYDLKKNLQVTNPTNEELRKEAVEETGIGDPIINKEEAGKVSTEDIAKIEEEALLRVRGLLGGNLNLNNFNSEALFSPAELTDEQRNEATQDITRIAGLTPDQQGTIVNFMYNQVVIAVDKNNGKITKAEADKIVDKSFNEIVMAMRGQVQDQIKEYKDLIEKFPQYKESRIPDAINALEHTVTKIDAVKAEIEKLRELAFDKIEKYTGIKQDREKEETGDEANQQEDKPNQKEKDFWTDILSESPENKLTYNMRRFFGQIRAKNKNGENVTGFLGLPIYEDVSVVTATLMTTLADVPSDFDTMLAKLEDRKAAIPWMQEVIDKLKNTEQQKKNQFVTVMSNHSLRMKFTMISYNQRTQTWTTKVYNTNQSGVAAAIENQWHDNLMNTDLVTGNADGTYSLNIERAKHLMQIFEGWKGLNVQDLSNPQLVAGIRDNIKPNSPVDFTPSDETLKSELASKLVKQSDRMKFSLKGFQYQITRLNNGKYRAEFLKQSTATDEEVQSWLSNFGIQLSDNTFKELKEKGLFHNYKQRKWEELFQLDNNTNGLFAILYNKLKLIVDKGGSIFEEEGNSPLEDSVVSSLANLEAKYNNVATPFGFRDGKKTIFALTAPKFITDRVRDLKDNTNDTVRKQLGSISFSAPSFWLRMMDNKDFRDKFAVSHMGLTAFKELGKKNYRDNALTKLSDLDHELTKLGMFWDTTQGQVAYTQGDKTLYTFPDTNIKLRMATMFSPTMSDKHLMTLITTAVLELKNTDLGNGDMISDEVTNVLYDQLVKPELKRMVKKAQLGASNISSYDKGAEMFMFLPSLNNVEMGSGVKLTSAIKHEPNTFTLDYIESDKALMDNVRAEIKAYVNQLVGEKVKAWEANGLIKEGKLEYVDSKYNDGSRFRGTPEQVNKMVAMDFVVNSLISNANSFMVMAGDPALYYKSKASDPIQRAMDSFVNVGKRLANQIAPGTPLANSEKEKYIQLFLQDRKSIVNNLAYLESILGKEGAAAYKEVEGSDAQEYTTWKEHLDILAKLGKVGDNLTDITPEEITEARELFASGTPKEQLTERQREVMGKVAQPIKPVYTGQIFDAAQDVMRTVYIKSSSFPLIPQLTAGMEIDKLRNEMEKIEKSRKMNVRASYQSANKVGSINNAIKVWNDDGTIADLTDLANSSLVLDRKNFRIQQEVPFKSEKTKEDKITLGTQIMKLLFGDAILDLDGFMYNGKSHSGLELHSKYNDLFIKLVTEKKNQLYAELGLDVKGTPLDAKKSMVKLQAILKDEAIKRGYPLQDIQGLTLNPDGDFNLPLWSSANSNRYESMLNAIVTNRLVRMKFPGNSYVVGSEEGFRVSDDLGSIDKSKVIWTSSWNGKELQGTTTEDGKLKSAQVLAASKFRDNEGNLVDLFTKENGEYKYMTKTENGFKLKEGMFDKELLKLFSFRIPTSGHQSASQIEIVGFLPHTSADLMIVPKGFTKQKGLDFDVDKENTYQLWHRMNKDGKFEVLDKDHRDEILLNKDKQLKELLASDKPDAKLIKAIFGEGTYKYSKEDIEEQTFLKNENSKIEEKLMQNEIIKIHHSIFSNPDKKVQAKINKVLSTDYAEQQADFIEKLSLGDNAKYWTPLSDEYQKKKMFLGAGGKIGTGAYSLDVVFHSLAQQAAFTGKPLTLTEVKDKQILPKSWRFGKITSRAQLGAVMTIDGGRSISEVQAERQNIAVDNEKLQVMGRVGLDDLTMDVDKVFNMVGLDKGSDGNSISFLFLSQPIIRDYVAMMKNASSNVSDYDAQKEAKIANALYTKYDPDKTWENIDSNDYEDTVSDLMTNENFVQAIQSEKPNALLQRAVLERFLEMKNYGIAIRGIQTTINVDSKGLGKSFFDVIEKRNALNRLAGSPLVQNTDALIGEFVKNDELEYEDKQALIEQGYIDIGSYLVKPTTLSGGFAIHGVTTAYNLWSRHFPYDAEVTQTAFDKIIKIIGKDEMSDTRTVELKQQIFQGIKKYLAAHGANGIVDGTTSVNEERRRLFIDNNENTSLANYVKQLLNTTGNAVIDTFIKTNKLINKFEFQINKNGEPSLIKFNNAAGEEFDEQYLYESLATLLEIRGKEGRIALPKIGNKQYTLDTLAQDLIAYSYLGNAVQEAIQFTKYVPVSYLNTVGYSQKMRQASRDLKYNFDTLKIGRTTEKDQHIVGEFIMQYIQHNPERVTEKHNQKTFDKLIKKGTDGSFTFKDERTPTFVSVYDPSIPKGEKKFKLYWFDGAKYVKIPVLGTFGMDEYQPEHGIGQSLVNGRVRIQAEPQSQVNTETNGTVDDPFNIEGGKISNVLSNIARAGLGSYSVLAEQLSSFLSDNRIGVKFVEQFETTFNGKTDTVTNFNGVYEPNGNFVGIHSRLKGQDSVKVAKIILHEVVHGLTNQQLNNYVIKKQDGKVEVKDNAPTFVTSLVRIYNVVREQSGINPEDFSKVMDDVYANKGLSGTQDLKKYTMANIDEFIAHAMTEPRFQEYLAKIKLPSGQSLLDKFKEIIKSVLTGIGVKFDSDSAAAQAINSIFDFIENTNPKDDEDFNPYQAFYDDSINEDYNPDNYFDGSSEGNLSVEFPDKPLNLIEENCL